MANQLIAALVTFLLGGVLGGFIQAVYSYKKEILSGIWLKRFEEYKLVWEITGVLPKFPEDRNVTYNDLYSTCIKLKNWYFKNGGIILSKKSRLVYEDVQEELYKIACRQTEEKVSTPDYKLLRETFSLFRAELTNDLTSRSRSLI